VAIERKIERRRPQLILWGTLAEVPWWALIILLVGAFIVYFLFTSATYQDAFFFLIAGVRLTIQVSLISFGLALILGLIAGLGRVSKNVVFYTISSVYVEVVRGIPILVLLIYFAYVVTPLAVDLLNLLGAAMLQNLAAGFLVAWGNSLAKLNIQDVNMLVRAITGLAFAYAAFEAEVFRAGIQSIERGQMEAARSLGMSYFQTPP
jgi:polar amino acid transport system permease protein